MFLDHINSRGHHKHCLAAAECSSQHLNGDVIVLQHIKGELLLIVKWFHITSEAIANLLVFEWHIFLAIPSQPAYCIACRHIIVYCVWITNNQIAIHWSVKQILICIAFIVGLICHRHGFLAAFIKSDFGLASVVIVDACCCIGIGEFDRQVKNAAGNIGAT